MCLEVLTSINNIFICFSCFRLHEQLRNSIENQLDTLQRVDGISEVNQETLDNFQHQLRLINQVTPFRRFRIQALNKLLVLAGFSFMFQKQLTAPERNLLTDLGLILGCTYTQSQGG